ncbi:MAG: nucleotide sugar dehydrogenase [Candidatus Dormibacteraeota bacterium]|nr:nucleotide sugar dehydrogenase [Candidatus Dormibacteraeota bacterium]MBV9526702.1 nucleotide sugar dehydrogenase [Candidatus Dormibacteraeota bacterium]
MASLVQTPTQARTHGRGAVRRAFDRDVVIVGGCGHVGLPLGIALGQRGLSVAMYDVNQAAVDAVMRSELPFSEPGADAPLKDLRRSNQLVATTDPNVIRGAEYVIVVIGTPVDEHLNPSPQAVVKAIADLAEHLTPDQVIVLRSTIYPGVTALVERYLEENGLGNDVCFCPERIAQGKAMEELHQMPQIIAARTARGMQRARDLFSRLAPDLIELSPEEAELAKLFTNTWRYIKFAAANQLFMMANDFGLDFERIRQAIITNYPRAADMPGPGFAAGPCLFKDTMQLAAFNNNQFTLGHTSMMINEGLPLYVVARLEQRLDLSSLNIGILGMAFKGESDDIRSSLAYKLKRILAVKARRVLCADPYVTLDPHLVPEEELLREADLIVIGAPHARYATLEIGQPVIDVFNVRRQGVLI